MPVLPSGIFSPAAPFHFDGSFTRGRMLVSRTLQEANPSPKHLERGEKSLKTGNLHDDPLQPPADQEYERQKGREKLKPNPARERKHPGIIRSALGETGNQGLVTTGWGQDVICAVYLSRRT